MAVEARRATPATLVPASPSPSFLRLALLATAATLGLSGAATAAPSHRVRPPLTVSAASGVTSFSAPNLGSQEGR